MTRARSRSETATARSKAALSPRAGAAWVLSRSRSLVSDRNRKGAIPGSLRATRQPVYSSRMPRSFGTDRVEATPSGCVAVVCALPKGWVARRPAAPGAVLHPGTAVRWEDGLWEVLTAEETAGGVRYELAPWDERHAVRLLVPYDERSEAERDADDRDLRRRRRTRIATLLLAPLAGLLPGHVQERLETELGLRATRLTLASVLAPMAAGTFALVMTLAAAVGGGGGIVGPAP